MSRWLTPFILFSSALSAASASSEQVNPYIINGINANQSDWPYITALVKKNKDAYTGQFCGGSLIKDRYVLTAAHCVDDLVEDGLDVIVGISNLNNSQFEGVRVSVKSVFINPSYNSVTLNNDVAVLELSRAITSNEATPVEIAGSATRQATSDGTSLKVAGWGSTTPDYGTHTKPSHLQEVTLPLVNQALCSQAMNGAQTVQSAVNSSNFCAGTSSEGYDSCRGDSGGPIIVENTGVQLGLVSWGRTRCGEQNSYGVYTNLSEYRTWIDQKTAGLSFVGYEDKGFYSLGTYTHDFEFTNYSSQVVSFFGNYAIYSNGVPAQIISDECSAKGTLSLNESCVIKARFDLNSYGSHEFHLNLSYNQYLGTAHTLRFEVEGALQADNAFASVIGLNGDIAVYSNDKPWVLSGENGLKSAPISHLEKSTLILDGVPEGNYEFDVKLASESSDLLYLYVNGESRGGVGGERSFTHNLPLTKTSNRIKFVYEKDASIDASDDAVYISNFRTAGSTTPSTTPTPSSGGGGGGSLGWVTISLLVLAARRRK